MSDLEHFAATLEASGDYRVLRRFVPRTVFRPIDDTPLKRGIILDVETTGLDPAKDQIIELGMIAFDFSAEGEVYGVADVFSSFRDPGIPIPPEITALTGITDEMVAGQAIDPDQVAAFIEPATVVIAHKAEFDRKFAEGLWDGFAQKAWACSLEQVDWRAEGFDGARLAYLLAGHGLFHEGHRAAHDCHALLEVLARPLRTASETALKRLLDTARKPTLRVWAVGSPFDLKDKLKARGYRWNTGDNGWPKSWWRDTAEAETPEEISWLQMEIYGREVSLHIEKIGPFNRYSTRVAG